MELRGEIATIRDLRPGDAEELLALRRANREFFRPWEPVPPESHFTIDGQRTEIERTIRDREADRAYAFGICDATGRLVGRIALSAVFRRAWQNANIGYYVAERDNGLGIATEAVGLTVQFAFEQAKLHRVQGAVMVRNPASIRVLEKNGFRREGYAERYLLINDAWEDHFIFAVTAEEWAAARAQRSWGEVGVAGQG